jgi:signal transduction histidine kinase
MASRTWLKNSTIYGVVVLIGLLLLANIYLIYHNSKVIEKNKNSYETAEGVKVNTADILRQLHLLDMLLRSYALTKTQRFLNTADSAFFNKDSIFYRVERPLRTQNFPMAHFQTMKDSVNAYYVILKQMRDHLANGDIDKFLTSMNGDPGFRAWIAFRDFSTFVNDFEDNIAAKAELDYERALQRSYFLQIVLFLITMPTLAYTAYYSVKTLKVSNLLRRSTEENNKILAEQNVKLDKMVAERTIEILSQNEEISAYNEEISAQNEEIASHNEQLVMQQQEIELQQQKLREHNEQLQDAKHVIEQQNREIQHKNEELATEVENQTKYLRETNLQLIEHNSRLEQFAYIISHNLRAPVARLVGLSSILEHASTLEEQQKIVKMMIKSTSELDQVIQDLGFILRIQKLSAKILSQINLQQVVDKVLNILEAEIRDTHAVINTNFHDVVTIYSLPQYFESIIYNLISNCIKYRHPDRTPVITISSDFEGDFIKVVITDNGLGIDLDRNKTNLFNLYKRFHFHVEGKGLGLYLVKTQMDALGGRIEVRSVVEEGTTFTLYFKNLMP